ncbi:hypothetical protein [Lysobacter tyrosinilyticus]
MRKNAAIALGFVAVMVITWFVARSSVPAATGMAAAATHVQTAPVLPTSSVKPIAAAPLPPLEAPLASAIDDLRRRANAGDPGAACRLAAELTECDELRYRRTEDERWLAQRQRALQVITDPAVRQMAVQNIDSEMALRSHRVDALAQHCAKVPPPTVAESVALWRQAALLGNPAALRQYASGNAFRWNNLMEALPQLQAYRGEAESMARQLARQGDIDMILALAAGYAPAPTASRSLLAQTLKPDGAKAMALYLRAQEALQSDASGNYAALASDVGNEIDALRAQLAPEDQARAAQMARTEFAGWNPPVLRGAQERINATGRQRDVHRAACSPVTQVM